MSQCKVCYAIENTNEEDSTAIQTQLVKKEITNVQLASILTINGYPVSESSIRRHLNHKDNQ